ncbi:MAG: TSUP family transporter [Phycisphaerales bacterium]
MVGAIVGALLIGLSLGLLGSGGSILTVPVLAYVLGRPEKLAIAESLAIVGAIAAVGALQYAIAKRVAWRVLLLFAPTSIVARSEARGSPASSPGRCSSWSSAWSCSAHR